MKHVLTVLFSRAIMVPIVSILITAVYQYFCPPMGLLIRSAVFMAVFGYISCATLMLVKTTDYRSLLFPKLLKESCRALLCIGNFFLFFGVMLGGLFTTELGKSFQVEMLIFGGAVIIVPTIFWYIAELKLTPKPGTMVVDEETDLYYLSGEVLPKLSSRVQVITSETKIPISVSAPIVGGPTVTVSQTFCFSAWVFKQDARNELPGNMYFKTNVNSAQGKLGGILAEKVKTLADIGKFFEPKAFPIPRNPSPYVWNDDLKVVVEKRK